MINTYLDSEVFWKKQETIPGSTRVPIDEIKRYFPKNQTLTILDLGSGSGRSTENIRESFPLSRIIAFDLSGSGLREIPNVIANKVEGTVLKLPFEREIADVVVLCGVMTNITDEDPDKAVKARKDTLFEVARVLKPGGICTISDFDRNHILSGYNIDYSKHELITKENGTIAVFDPTKKVTFLGKSRDEISDLAKSPDLQRFAHHYDPEELINICREAGLKPVSYSTEIARTPSGNPIDGLILTVVKPQ